MTLYVIGPLILDTFPFNADSADRRGQADFAIKPVVSGLQPLEPMGEGDDTLIVAGQLMPFKIGGLSHLALADQLRIAQQPLPCQRGDGRSFGWRVIVENGEKHQDLMRNGVGFTVDYELRLRKVPPPYGAAAAGVISMVTSLFSVLGR
ncbi:phage tail protein [Aurantimonas coralicida]|mgnify:CR=1 FL=1|uniref:phage tail protein n=1 Tax=Aurantimonas coralicida TaxID=182270 RepID=UPI001E4DF073|nr:phage tail protein [Aurantimonas coralicida]MCD1644339.1 phage tail protein [Aurantimonas coralicida]